MSAGHRHPPCRIFIDMFMTSKLIETFSNDNGYSQRFNTLDARLFEIISTLGLLRVKMRKIRDKIKAKNSKG